MEPTPGKQFFTFDPYSPLRLILGDVTLDVAMGTPCGFLQQLATIKKDVETGPEMTIVGQLSHRLVCTPDLDAMLEDR